MNNQTFSFAFCASRAGKPVGRRTKKLMYVQTIEEIVIAEKDFTSDAIHVPFIPFFLRPRFLRLNRVTIPRSDAIFEL